MSLEKLKVSFKKPFIIFFILAIVYFISRLINLEILPIFNDESTYIRYGVHQLNEPVFKPYSLLIGKEPLLPQFFAAFGSAAGDLLLGARIVSILFGFLTLTGLFFFSLKIFNKKTALFVGLIYILSPFNLFFDRLALLDSAVCTIAVWSLFLTYLIILKPEWWKGIALGILVGAGLYIKTTAFFYLFLPFTALIPMYFEKNKNTAGVYASAKVLILFLITALVIFFPLFTNEYYKIHLELLKQYTYPIGSIFTFPISVWTMNLTDVAIWLIFYLTPPLLLISIYGLIKSIRNQKLWIISFWFFFPLIYEILFAKLFTARHVLLLSMPLLILGGWGLYLVLKKQKIIFYITLTIIVVWCIFYDIFIWFNPLRLPSLYFLSARRDANQYVQGFSSGYGVIEAIDYLKEKSKNKQIIIVTRKDTGNPEDALVGYLIYNPNIQFVLIKNVESFEDFRKTYQISKEMYFVSRGAYFAGMEKYLSEERKFTKPNDKEFVGVYKLKSE